MLSRQAYELSKSKTSPVVLINGKTLPILGSAQLRKRTIDERLEEMGETELVSHRLTRPNPEIASPVKEITAAKDKQYDLFHDISPEMNDKPRQVRKEDEKDLMAICLNADGEQRKNGLPYFLCQYCYSGFDPKQKYHKCKECPATFHDFCYLLATQKYQKPHGHQKCTPLHTKESDLDRMEIHAPPNSFATPQKPTGGPA